MSKKQKKKIKKEAATSPLRSKTFSLLLYTEWQYFVNIIAYIKQFKYAYIIHDKDLDDDGEIKKSHCHVVLVYGGRRTLSSVQNEFKKVQLEPRFIETCNERAMLRYLIHKDDLDKYQYSKNEIQTNIKERLEVALQDEITSEIAFNLLNEFIYSNQKHITQYQFNKYAYEHNLMIGIRRYSSALNNALREHNRACEEEYHRMNSDELNDFLKWKLKNAEKKVEVLSRKKENKESVFD